MVEPNAQMRPNMFDREKSTDVASMTPNVKGKSETYVGNEYLTPNSRAYARTVNRGESAYEVVSSVKGLKTERPSKTRYPGVDSP